VRLLDRGRSISQRHAKRPKRSREVVEKTQEIALPGKRIVSEQRRKQQQCDNAHIGEQANTNGRTMRTQGAQAPQTLDSTQRKTLNPPGCSISNTNTSK
jgi:hypothetical protein